MQSTNHAVADLWQQDANCTTGNYRDWRQDRTLTIRTVMELKSRKSIESRDAAGNGERRGHAKTGEHTESSSRPN